MAEATETTAEIATRTPKCHTPKSRGGHQGDDDVEHQPARVLAVADVGLEEALSFRFL